MSTLVLEMRAGEMMIVNGAPIRFRTKVRLELTAHARFLFGKQIMSPAGANSPARRIYFALQSAYIGTDEERVRGLAAARAFIAEFKQSTTSSLARDILDRALAAAEADNCFAALKLVRRIIRHEDSVLGRAETEFVTGAPARSTRSAVGARAAADDRDPIGLDGLPLPLPQASPLLSSAMA
jgi:flagellar protein FlbT